MPPNLRATGTLSVTQQDRETLRAWLAEGGWPRGSMDGAMLEGYLVALLVWPVGIPPGAWLPPIWGERGWKVAAKIASADTYARFTSLVIGLLQELDRGFSARPPYFVPMLPGIDATATARTAAISCWAQGFLRALQQDLQGMGGRSREARSAVEYIARLASPAVTTAGDNSVVAAALTSAVLTLVTERTSRGPLGVLGS